MKFCRVCNNVKFITTSDQLVYLCAVCGDKEVASTSEGSICVVDDNKVNDEILYNQYINKYIKHDPTLPRINNIDCPNPDCTKKDNEEPETIYVKYDFTRMKYLYHCCHCSFTWRTDIKK